MATSSAQSLFEADLVAADAMVALLRARRESPSLQQETVGMLDRAIGSLRAQVSTKGATSEELKRAVPDKELRSVLEPFRGKLERSLAAVSCDSLDSIVSILEKARSGVQLTDGELARATELLDSTDREKANGGERPAARVLQGVSL